jgi:hypothetical protein
LMSAQASDRMTDKAVFDRWKFSFWLFVASVAINVAVVLLTRQHETVATIDQDEREYWDIATHLRDFGLSGVPATRTPPFPLLVAVLRAIVGNDYFHVQIALSALIAISPVLLFWLVQRRIGSERVAKCASIMLLLWPPFVRYSATLYSDSAALMVFLVYLLAYPLKTAAGDATIRRWIHFCIAGGILGLCLQVKPLYLIYVPFAFALAAFGESAFRPRVYAASFLLAGCIITALPWSAYLSMREGHVIPVSANDGETLAGGLNPALLHMPDTSIVTDDNRATWVGPGKWLQTWQTGYLSDQEQKLPLLQQSALLKERTLAWIKSNPGAALYISARKLLYMWGIYPFWNDPAQTLLGNVPLLLIGCAALFGLWINRRNFADLSLFWTLPIFCSAVCLISWGSWRFRMPGDVGLIVLAAMPVANWVALFLPIRGLSLLYDNNPSRGSVAGIPKDSRI